MSANSSIEWTDATWNPTRGCSRFTPGCGGANHQGGCYAERIAARFSEPGMPFHGFAERTAHGGRWTGKLALVEEQLYLPLRWRKPRRIFVNSMSDLFHEALPDEAIDQVFAVMALTPWHTHQVLTKRDERMRRYMTTGGVQDRIVGAACELLGRIKSPAVVNKALNRSHLERGRSNGGFVRFTDGRWPMPNVWLGCSVEDAERKSRIDELRATPAFRRFLSIEPLLEDLGELDLAGIHWVIVGGESGPNSRHFDIAWPRRILQQCRAAGVAYFGKQLGAKPVVTPLASDRKYRRPLQLRDHKGGDWSEWPEDLKVREFPDAA